MALGALDAVRFDAGLRVPQDIQIVGHDDTGTARYRSYQLTSVRQDMQQILMKAIDAAYHRLEHRGGEAVRIEVPNALFQRGSTLDGGQG